MMHFIVNFERRVFKELSKASKKILQYCLAFLSSHRLHSTRKSRCEEFHRFLHHQTATIYLHADKRHPLKLKIKLGSRFGLRHQNCAAVVLYFDSILLYLEKFMEEETRDIRILMKQNSVLVRVELSFTMILWQRVIGPTCSILSEKTSFQELQKTVDSLKTVTRNIH